jgi:hypothetical protein
MHSVGIALLHLSQAGSPGAWTRPPSASKRSGGRCSAVDRHGQTINFLLTEQPDQEAALRFLTQAIRRHGVPEKIEW